MKNFYPLCGLIFMFDLFVYSYSFLLWKEGINWIQMVVGVGVPVDLQEQTITIGTAVKSYYLLPTNTSNLKFPFYDLRKGRSFLRQNIYSFIENIMERNGYGDGKSCLLKLICEHSPHFLRNRSLMYRVLDLLLRPSKTVDGTGENIYNAAENMGKNGHNCTFLFPECKKNIFNII